MRRISLVVFLLSVIALGVTALAANPNVPPGCEPCGSDFSDDKNPEERCSSLWIFVDAYKGSGEWVGSFINRCWACATPGVYCTREWR